MKNVSHLSPSHHSHRLTRRDFGRGLAGILAAGVAPSLCAAVAGGYRRGLGMRLGAMGGNKNLIWENNPFQTADNALVFDIEGAFDGENGKLIDCVNGVYLPVYDATKCTKFSDHYQLNHTAAKLSGASFQKFYNAIASGSFTLSAVVKHNDAPTYENAGVLQMLTGVGITNFRLQLNIVNSSSNIFGTTNINIIGGIQNQNNRRFRFALRSNALTSIRECWIYATTLGSKYFAAGRAITISTIPSDIVLFETKFDNMSGINSINDNIHSLKIYNRALNDNEIEEIWGKERMIYSV